MTFTVVRAVRGADLAVKELERPFRLAKTAAPHVSAASMDLPQIADPIRLDFESVDFAETVRDPLE